MRLKSPVLQHLRVVAQKPVMACNAQTATELALCSTVAAGR